MAVEIYLQVADDADVGWLNGTTGQPTSSGWDTQLLIGAPTSRRHDPTAPRVFVGELPPGARAARGHSLPLPLRVDAILGDAERVLDEALIERMVLAFDAPGTDGARVGSLVEVWRFLREHQGKRVRLVHRSDAGHQAGSVVEDAMLPALGADVGDHSGARVAAPGIARLAHADDRQAYPTSMPGSAPPSALAALDAVIPATAALPADMAPPDMAPSAEATDSPDAVPATGAVGWGAATDWLTLAALRAVVIGIVALHLFVLVGEALIATP